MWLLLIDKMQLRDLPGLPRVMLLVSSQGSFTRRVLTAASVMGLVGPSVQWVAIGSAADDSGEYLIRTNRIVWPGCVLTAR